MKMVLDVDSAKKRIHKWLREAKFVIEEIDDKKSYFRFAIRVTKKAPVFFVIQQKQRSDGVTILFPIHCDKRMKEGFESMGEESRSDLISRLRVNVAISGTGSVLKLWPNPKSLDSINLYKVIYYDGLSKDRFFEIVNILRNLFVMILTTLSREEPFRKLLVG